MTLEIGRICMKIAGREAGKYCVILKKMDDNFVLITGPNILTQVKRRRCNVEHLEPTSFTVKIDAEASDAVVMGAYEKAGLLTKLGLRKPGPEVVKEAEKPKKEVKKEEKPKEEKVEKKEEKKPEAPKSEEKPKEEKKPMSLKIKIPSFRKKKEVKEEKKPEKKEEKKEKKKPEKKKKK
jgi:large subunit ribosomal protein L14e